LGVFKQIVKWLAVLVLANPAGAQVGFDLQGERSLLSLNGGFSIPVMSYGSSDINNRMAGFAKPDYMFDLNYVYLLGANQGITGSVIYCTNKAGSNNVQATSLQSGYRFLGLLAGPFITKRFFSRWDADFKLLAGATRVLTPNLEYNEAILLKENKATSFTWGGGIAIRYQLSGRSFLRLAADHLNLNPQYNVKQAETAKPEQIIVVMNVEAGIGFRF